MKTSVVVEVREKNGKGTRRYLVPRVPTGREKVAAAVNDYLAELQREVVAVAQRVAAVTAKCVKLIRPCRTDLYEPDGSYSGRREGEFDALLLAPRCKGSRARFSTKMTRF